MSEVMTSEEKAIAALREEMERKSGCKMQTPKDFDLLSQSVAEECRETVSPNTLKRLWGYLDEKRTPRHSTLNILSQYVGFDDWASFCKNVASEPEVLADEDPSTPPPRKSRQPISKCA